MPKIIKGQLANIVFPMVDGTDFASIESGITASDFNSAATRQYIGVNHGNSATVALSALSKATELVRSGIFKHTLNESETNFDMIVLRFTHPSCADQILIFEAVDYDDSDIMSRLSDVTSDLRSYLAGRSQLSDLASNLRSYLVGMSGALSDVDSQLLLNASMISDAHSAASQANSRALLLLSNVSDVQSALDSQFVWSSNMLSDMLSDLTSQIGGIAATVSASDISDIASAVWANTIGARVDSRVLLIQSNVSDVDSALTSQYNATSNYLSQIHSDIVSALGNISVTLTASDISDIASAVTAAGVNLTASDMSDIASRVWATAEGTRVDSRILVIQSMVSDVDSQVLLNASMISDIDSALVVVDTAVNFTFDEVVIVRSLASDAQSAAREASSRALIIQSVVSDVDSALTSQFNYLSDTLSDMRSDLNSVLQENMVIRRNTAQAGAASTITLDASASSTSNFYNGARITLVSGTGVGQTRIITSYNGTTRVATIAPNWTTNPSSDTVFIIQPWARVEPTVSAMSDIASQVWAHAVGTRVDSRLRLVQSNVSDVESALDSQFAVETSFLSDVYSLLSDVDSQLLINASMISDIDSQIDAGVTVSASSISDITSNLWAHSLTEPIGVVAAGPTAEGALAWLNTLARNEIITDGDSGAMYLRNDADDSNIASAAVSDDGSQFIRGEWA